MTDSRKSGGPSADEDLERLRKLILGDKFNHMDSLYDRVTQPESRTDDVAEVLPGAINRVVEDPVARPEIERPIVDAIQSAIKRDTESFAEALFPVLGPAIRRAIADALKSLVQRINLAMENSFTIKGLRWRMQAAKSGVPFGQVVLRETMLYAVQEVFLIQPESGLVLASARRDDTLVLDEDAFSAMLTAIQAFIRDSFGTAASEPLRSAELGDRTLWLINGPKAVLACVIIGSPPHEVREQLMNALEKLHARFGDKFGQHPEHLAREPGVTAVLQDALSGQVAVTAQKPKHSKSRFLWGGLGLALLLYIAWSAWSTLQDNRLEQRLAGLFESEPGYVLTSHDIRDRRFFLAGLRDPLARSPDSLLQDINLDVGLVNLRFRPYQSLEEEIILRRLQAALGDSASLTMELSESSLAVEGTLTSAQFEMLEDLPGVHPIIRSVDLAQTRLAPQEAVEWARRQLSAPPSVTLAPSGSNDRIEVSGSATAEWFGAAAVKVETVGGWSLDFTPLRKTLTERLNQLQQRLNETSIQFSWGLEITPQSQGELVSVARDLIELQSLAAVLQARVGVQLEGYADGTGTVETNQELAMNRARTVRSRLGIFGVEPGSITLVPGRWKDGVANPQLRKAVLQVIMESSN